MARIYEPRKGYSGTPIQTSTGVYGLAGLERVWEPRKGYVFKSEKYPGGVPRTIGRFTVGPRPSAASTARALSSGVPSSRAAAMLITSGVPPITAGQMIYDPKIVEDVLGTGGLARGITGGGRGVGAAAGVGVPAPGQVAAGLDGGISSSLSAMSSGVMNTAASYIPIAIKLILLAIGVKVVLWLIRGKK